MTSESPLHQFVHRRFREVFGDPNNSLGRDDHWALKPDRYRAAINVLVNGTGGNPVVWVFDPHCEEDGPLRTIIDDEQALGDLIKKIQDRVKAVALKPDRTGNV